MCIPAAAALFIAQAGQAVMSYAGQKQQAKAQENAIRANDAQQMQTMEVQQWQARGAASEQMSERAKAAATERARLTVLSAESGLAGANTDRMFNESAFNAGQDITSIQRNARNTQQQQELEKKSLRTQNEGKFNTIQRPSILGTGLQIAGSYADYKTKTTPK